MSSIDGVGNSGLSPSQMSGAGAASPDDKSSGFGDVMSRIADGTLATVSSVAPVFPGGQLVKLAADGLRELRGGAPGLPGQSDDQMSEMFQMQRENQAFNLQYMQLQNELQADNRRFSTLTNLMKVRHDTAKAAINNMQA